MGYVREGEKGNLEKDYKMNVDYGIQYDEVIVYVCGSPRDGDDVTVCGRQTINETTNMLSQLDSDQGGYHPFATTFHSFRTIDRTSRNE
jgi:hypothetical protein